jgi:hypothetical protein
MSSSPTANVSLSDFSLCLCNRSGTVYFATMNVKLFQDMAKSAGGGTTINDILRLCVSIAFGSYFDHVGIRRSDVGGVKLLLPVANPIPPSLYNDGEYGLRNGMTPVIVPLKLPSGEYASIMEALKDIQSYMLKVKQSNTPLLMSCINRLLQHLVPVEKIAEKGLETFQRVSCVWSNVPGPYEAGESCVLWVVFFVCHLFFALLLKSFVIVSCCQYHSLRHQEICTISRRCR